MDQTEGKSKIQGQQEINVIKVDCQLLERRKRRKLDLEVSSVREGDMQ